MEPLDSLNRWNDRLRDRARAMLDDYVARRRRDRWAGVAFTHGLVHLFGTDLPFVRWPRGIGLALLDAVPPLKRTFTRAMLFGA